MREVYVVSVGMIPFGKYPDKGIKDLTAEVMADLFTSSPVTQDEIEAAWMSNAGWGMQIGQHCIRGQVALGPLGIGEIPIMNVENACAGGSSAFHGAVLGVGSGAYDIALAVGAEQSLVRPAAGGAAGQRDFSGFLAGTDVEVTVKQIEAMQAEAEKKRLEMEARGELKKGEGGGARSPFMDIYSSAARAHFERYGSNQRQLAIIAAKNHHHGSLNPKAQYRMDMTVDDVMKDRLVSHPLTRAMCAPTGDGAAAAILVSRKVLKRLKDAMPIRVKASVLGSARRSEKLRLDHPAVRAYKMARLRPDDIDLAEVHDATAFGELSQTESLGFCGVGEGGRYAESGATALGGRRPINTSGGLECRGHPIGASGLAMIAEIVEQLQGVCGERQVKNARTGLTQNGGGFVGTGEAANAIHILQRAD